MDAGSSGSTPDPAPAGAEKGRATKDHCDRPAAGSESEGVRRLRVEPQRTQRTRRNAEAAVSVPVRRLCGRAMLAWTCHSERFSNPGPVEAAPFSQPNREPKAKTAAPPSFHHRPRRHRQGNLPSHRLNEGPRATEGKNMPPSQKIRAPLRGSPSHTLKMPTRERLTG